MSISLTINELKKIKDVSGMVTGGDVVSPANISGISVNVFKEQESNTTNFYLDGNNGRFTGETADSDNISVGVKTLAEMIKRIQLIEAKLNE